ncbi:dihydroorotate dehydrogenase [Streptomyces sp. Agncl-13]|uniref:dihydroorotate dehydrogenase n=1 Tax=Streptomyces sp. Agncl-13 TaxID=3400628 RepID=UPI003A8ACD21
MNSAADERLEVTIGNLTLANPVMPASGCFGPELAPVTPLGGLGAVVTKTVFDSVRSGNPAHRLDEVRGGMLNSVGIPSPGMDVFRERTLPAYEKLGPPVIVSLGGLAVREYADAADALADTGAAAFEVNVSCPNLEHSGLEIGADPAQVEKVTALVRERARGRPVIVKLTPNVTSIAEIARAAEAGGADAVTVANTFVGMSIDRHSRRPSLGNGVGGLSGPAIRPLVLRLVWQTARAVSVPVIACGGAGSVDHVAEYLIAGACAVQIGTATFTRPSTMTDIIADLRHMLDELGARTLSDLSGSLGMA